MAPSLDCPFCDEPVPVRVDITGEAVEKGYVVVTDYLSSNDPIPHIEVGISLNLEKLARDIERLRKERKELDDYFGQC